MTGTYIAVKKKQKKPELSVLTHTAPTLELVISSFGSFLGKRILKSQDLGEGGQKTQTSIVK